MARPNLHPDILRSFEERGVDGVRASLYHAAAQDPLGFATPSNKQPLYALRETDSGTVSATRGDAERWLAWKGRRSDAWVKGGTLAALAAALLALCAWLFPLGR